MTSIHTAERGGEWRSDRMRGGEVGKEEGDETGGVGKEEGDEKRLEVEEGDGGERKWTKKKWIIEESRVQPKCLSLV